MPPEYRVFYIAVAAVFGLLFGSFLNVCIYRVARDLSVVMPRSFCPECGRTLSWYDNIPLLSFLLLRGRCRHCRCAIGVRYPIVELSTGFLFGVIASRYGFGLSALKWGIFECTLVALFWIDLEERLLPDEFTIGGALAGFVFSFLVPVRGPVAQILLWGRPPLLQSVASALLGAVLLALPMWTLGAVYQRIRKREGLGLGDVKLLLLLGMFLGLENGLTALLIGAVSGSVLGLSYILIARKDSATYELPFGSFICLGAAIMPLVFRL